MYSADVAARIWSEGMEASTAVELGLAGRSDMELFAAATTGGHTVVSENVADFTRLAADATAAGQPHHGLLIALSSRFSRRPEGHQALVAAVLAVARDDLRDRVVFLERVDL